MSATKREAGDKACWRYDSGMDWIQAWKRPFHLVSKTQYGWIVRWDGTNVEEEFPNHHIMKWEEPKTD